MLYHIDHVTTYEYAEPASLCQNLAHLAPRNTPYQGCRETRLSIEPEPAVLSTRVDYFGNTATFFAVQERHLTLEVAARHYVEVAVTPARDLAQTPAWEIVRARLQSDREPNVLAASQFVFGSRAVRPNRELADYAAPSFPAGRPLGEAVLDLTSRIHHDFIYDTRATTVATALSEVFARRRGVCQDFSHLAIGCLRSLGLAARYVSGYLNTDPPPGCVPLVGADATHAWLSVFCPGCGWIDTDPTNNQVPDERYVVLAWGRDYDDVSPLKGIVLGGGQHTVRVAVKVSPAGDSP